MRAPEPTSNASARTDTLAATTLARAGSAGPQPLERALHDAVNAVRGLPTIKLYNRSGNRFFTGDLAQLLSFWNARQHDLATALGEITDERGNALIRFGPVDGRGFIARSRIPDVFYRLAHTSTQERAKHLHIDDLREQNNAFSPATAKQVIAITKDWLRFGGNLYDHLTGKNVRLEKGVDFALNPDGTPNLASYRAERQRKIDAWLQEPGNRHWLAAGTEFEQTHRHELSYMPETVLARQADGTTAQKERYTTPYLYQNGWLYYEPNYFDQRRGSMRQPEQEPTKYRVYFTVEGGEVFSTFQELIHQLAADPVLQRVGFQAKTADVGKISQHEIGMLMHQKDRIVLYLGEQGMKQALPLLQRYAETHAKKFQQPGALFAQPLLGTHGQIIPGVTLTSETRGTSPDPEQFIDKYSSFNDMQSMIIESSFRSIIKALKDHRALEQLGAKYPLMKERLTKLPKNASQTDYLQTILTDPHGETLLINNLARIYPYWAKAFGMKERNTAFKE